MVDTFCGQATQLRYQHFAKAACGSPPDRSSTVRSVNTPLRKERGAFSQRKTPESLDFSTFPGISSSSRRQDSKYLPPHNTNKQEVYSTPFSLYPTLYPFCNHSCNYFLSSLKSTIKRLPLSIDPKPTGLISTSNRNLNVPVIPLQYLSI